MLKVFYLQIYFFKNLFNILCWRLTMWDLSTKIIDINRHGQLDPVLIEKQSINVLMNDEYI